MPTFEQLQNTSPLTLILIVGLVIAAAVYLRSRAMNTSAKGRADTEVIRAHGEAAKDDSQAEALRIFAGVLRDTQALLAGYKEAFQQVAVSSTDGFAKINQLLATTVAESQAQTAADIEAVITSDVILKRLDAIDADIKRAFLDDDSTLSLFCKRFESSFTEYQKTLEKRKGQSNVAQTAIPLTDLSVVIPATGIVVDQFDSGAD